MAHARCPECGGTTSRLAKLGMLATLAGSSVFAMTLMACYGMPAECYDSANGNDADASADGGDTDASTDGEGADTPTGSTGCTPPADRDDTGR